MDCYYTAIYFKFIEAGYDVFIDYANKMHFLLNISSLISSKDFFSLDSKQYFFRNRSSVSRNRWSQSNPAIVEKRTMTSSTQTNNYPMYITSMVILKTKPVKTNVI